MSRPLISVITPTYNHERFIAECIESVLAQTYDQWEMLVVDDGSTDQTWEIVQQYACRDQRIRVFHQDNKGIWRLAETYNFALAQAKGELVAILEGDDYWPVDKLATQVPYHINNPDLLLSHGKVTIVKDGAKIGEYPHPSVTGLLLSEQYFCMALFRKSCIMPVSVIVNKTRLEQNGGFFQDSGFAAIDYSTWLRLFKLSGKVIWLDHILGYWRQSSEQVTQNVEALLAESVLRIALEQLGTLPSSLTYTEATKRKSVIKAHYKLNILPAYVAITRKALLHKDKNKAAFYAIKLIKHGTPKRKLQGLYTLLACCLGWNMEPILRCYEVLNRFIYTR